MSKQDESKITEECIENTKAWIDNNRWNTCFNFEKYAPLSDTKKEKLCKLFRIKVVKEYENDDNSYYNNIKYEIFWNDEDTKNLLNLLEILDLEKVTIYTKTKEGEYYNLLTNIIIPEGITKIGVGTFAYFNQLESISLPTTLKSICSNAFLCCENLREINFNNSLESIGRHAFEGCDSLVNIKIPDSVTNIGIYAFHNCKQLESVVLPKNLKNLKNDTFSYNCKLKEITFGDAIESIGSYCFSYCYALPSSIKLPDSIKILKSSIFCGTNVNRLYIGGPNIESIALDVFGMERYLEKDAYYIIANTTIEKLNDSFQGYWMGLAGRRDCIPKKWKIICLDIPDISKNVYKVNTIDDNIYTFIDLLEAQNTQN